MKKYFKRKQNRIPKYSYSSINGYFITICTKDKKCLFGNINNEQMILSSIGKVVENEIKELRTIYNNIDTDYYVIMPNHIHIIIVIYDWGKVDISRVVNQFKGKISKKVGFSIWQKSFYDHVIRNEKDYLRIWEYIDENVLKWDLDEYHV